MQDTTLLPTRLTTQHLCDTSIADKQFNFAWFIALCAEKRPFELTDFWRCCTYLRSHLGEGYSQDNGPEIVHDGHGHHSLQNTKQHSQFSFRQLLLKRKFPVWTAMETPKWNELQRSFVSRKQWFAPLGVCGPFGPFHRLVRWCWDEKILNTPGPSSFRHFTWKSHEGMRVINPRVNFWEGMAKIARVKRGNNGFFFFLCNPAAVEDHLGWCTEALVTFLLHRWGYHEVFTSHGWRGIRQSCSDIYQSASSISWWRWCTPRATKQTQPSQAGTMPVVTRDLTRCRSYFGKASFSVGQSKMSKFTSAKWRKE